MIQTLRQYFGFDAFRPGQQEVVEAIVQGRDALAVMPTGAGKSLCYQLPALLLPGITLVISPLISLMQDQVKALIQNGIRAAYINSSLTEPQINKALQFAAAGRYKIIYVAPERLETYSFRQFAACADISMVTVDEAHCISQWGQDFRPSYLRIVDFIRALPRRPILSCFTATATQEVMQDIQGILMLHNPIVTVNGFDRPNLYFSVERPKDKDGFVLDFLKQHTGESGIIYCATRKNTDNLCDLLNASGFRAAKYHAGMEMEERRQSQNDFVYDRVDVIVATNAFGMGIDKSNVRFVLHYNMPQSMENYYQEAGRAGRDGNPAKCVLLFSGQDVMINTFLLEKKDFTGTDPMEAEIIRRRDFQRLRSIETYCKTTRCLRCEILSYFGEAAAQPCGHCGNCDMDFEERDVTAEAVQIVNCASQTGGSYGAVILCGILTGSTRAKYREMQAERFPTYGALKDCAQDDLRQIIAQLVDNGYLEADEIHKTLRPGRRARELNHPEHRVILQMHSRPAEQPKAAKSTSFEDLTPLGMELFNALRELRRQIAFDSSVPPYVVFSDKTLQEMARRQPQNEEQLLDIPGVAQTKLERYGARFLTVLNDFAANHPDQPVFTAPQKPAKTRNEKAPFALTAAEAANVVYTDYAYTSELRNAINACIDLNGKKGIFGTQITAWLEEIGYLTRIAVGSLSDILYPTEQGLAAGIQAEERTSQRGTAYYVIRLPRGVQEMVVEHLVAGRVR